MKQAALALLLVAATAAPAQTAADLAAQARALDAAARERAQTSVRLQREAVMLSSAIASSARTVAAAAARARASAAAERAARARLAELNRPLAQMLAAVQRLARRPAALALAAPQSLTEQAHARAMLTALLPLIRQRTEQARAEIAAVRAAKMRSAQAQQALERERAVLLARRDALIRNAALRAAESSELSQQALSRGDEALRVKELERAPRLRAATLRRGGSSPFLLPVEGQVLVPFGAVQPDASRAPSLLLATPPGRPVLAPAAGRVLFAGQYRGYGNVVILDHGGGLLTLLTRLGTNKARGGQQVGRGQVLGTSGARTEIEVQRGGQPIDPTRLVG